jgi:hypothetical protein
MTDSPEFSQLEWRNIQDELFSFEVEIESLIRDIQAIIAEKKTQTSVVHTSNLYWQSINTNANNRLKQLYEAVIEYLAALVDNRIVQTISINWLLARYPFVHPEVPKQEIFLKITSRIAKKYAQGMDQAKLQRYSLPNAHFDPINTIANHAHIAVYKMLTKK